MVQQLAFNLHSLTNGSQGLDARAPDRSPSRSFERPFYLAMLGAASLGAHARAGWVRGSKLGLMLFAIRDDEDRARGRGRPRTTGAKLIALVG